MFLKKILPQNNIILVFHDIQSSKWFEDTLLHLKNYYHFISMDDLSHYFVHDEPLERCCHITFDDGDISFYNHVFPVLKKLKIPATLFVSPKIIQNQINYWFQDFEHLLNNIDHDLLKKIICEFNHLPLSKLKKFNPLSIIKNLKIAPILSTIDHIYRNKKINKPPYINITTQQLKEINDSKLVTIGAHTMNHPILKNETDENSKKEIADSIINLSSLLKQDINCFAFPNGQPDLDFTDRELNYLTESKIKISMSTYPCSINKDDNQLSLSRIGFGGLKKENKHYVITKLFLSSLFWDKISLMTDKIHFERKIISNIMREIEL